MTGHCWHNQGAAKCLLCARPEQVLGAKDLSITQDPCPPKARTKNSGDADGRLNSYWAVPSSAANIISASTRHPLQPHPPKEETHTRTPQVPQCRRGSWLGQSPGNAPRSIWASCGPGLRLMPPPCESATGHSHRLPQGQPTWPNNFGNNRRCLTKVGDDYYVPL